MKHQKTADLVACIVHRLDDSRSLRAGLLQIADTEVGKHRGLARKALADGDAEALARTEWFSDPTRLRRAGIKKVLKGWRNAAELAAVDAWPLGRYDAVQHPGSILRVDEVVAELVRRFPDTHDLLRAECEAAGLSPLLYSDLPSGARSAAAWIAVHG